MSSTINKTKIRLANIAKDRDNFEIQKKKLQLEMETSKLNLLKIKKGVNSKEIGILDLVHTVDPKAPPKILRTSILLQPKNYRPTEINMNLISNLLIPSGARVSDWCFVGIPDSSPPIVKSFDLYETVRLLGRGSFGDVNLVKSNDTNKLYAMKTIYCEKEEDWAGTLREVEFLRKHRHPCIIDVSDCFILHHPRILHILMQYCETGDLGKVISNAQKSKSNIPEGNIIKWVYQIALALHYIHENGCIHRDLKPCNVMITEGGDQIKLADFGLAVELKNGICSSSSEAGTPVYTSPEMIQGFDYSCPSDCWSFGIMIYELLCLDLPFDGVSTGDLVKCILNNEPKPLPSFYSEEIRTICKSLLIKNQSERLSMTGLLIDPFIHSKVISYPKKYLPKALEERIKRAHARQLIIQIEGLNSDTINTSNKSPPVNISLISTPLSPTSINKNDSPIQLSPIQITLPFKDQDDALSDTLLFESKLVPAVPVVQKSFKSPRKINVINESKPIDDSQLIIKEDINLKDDFISDAVPVSPILPESI